MNVYNNETPVAILTVAQLKEIIGDLTKQEGQAVHKEEPKYVYGIAGIACLFNCSIPTANRIKQSGTIDAAIKQIGRKIIVDVHLALELAGSKKGGRKK